MPKKMNMNINIQARYRGQSTFAPENPKPGDWYEDDNGDKWVCGIDGAQWLKIDASKISDDLNTGMTEYELNKDVVAQLPSLITPEQLAPARKVLEEYFSRPRNTDIDYYMLLCNDIRYYTVFRRGLNFMAEHIEDLVIECLQDVGVIQQINFTEDEENVECWIKNENGVFMFMLFNYNWGIIECQ